MVSVVMGWLALAVTGDQWLLFIDIMDGTHKGSADTINSRGESDCSTSAY